MASAQAGSAAPAVGGDGGAPGAGGASSFIGALISLLSRSDIRYQGFLNSIDSAQATIALEKGEGSWRVSRRVVWLIETVFVPIVRSWGTEGRLAKIGKANEELPPNENVYDFIVFRAADVKDLKIDDPHPDRSRPPPPPPQAFQDPAILGVSTQYLKAPV
jgi:protein LSM14